MLLKITNRVVSFQLSSSRSSSSRPRYLCDAQILIFIFQAAQGAKGGEDVDFEAVADEDDEMPALVGTSDVVSPSTYILDA